MDFADYIMLVLILGLGASVIFSVALQAVVTMVAVVYKPSRNSYSLIRSSTCFTGRLIAFRSLTSSIRASIRAVACSI